MNLNPLSWFQTKAAPVAPWFAGQTLTPPIEWRTYRHGWTERGLLNLFVDTAYYCVNLNANGVAGTNLCMYRKTGTGERRQGKPTKKHIRRRLKEAGYIADGDEPEEITEHPFFDLLDKPFHNAKAGDRITPNLPPVMGRYSFMYVTQRYLETLGRSYWLIDGPENGPPVQLCVLMASDVEAYKSPQSELFIDVYKYSVGGVVKEYQPSEIVPFLFESMGNPYTGGYGPLEAAADRIGVQMAYLHQTQSWLNNRARPDSVISAEGQGEVISKPVRDRLEEWFKLNFRRDKIGMPLIADQPVKVQPLQFTPKDLGELRDEEQAIKQTARIFDVPMALLDNDSNRANASEGRKQHAHTALSPRLRRLEQTINAHLIPRYGDPRLFVAFDEPFSEPMAPAVADLAAIDFLTPDEKREMMGYGPMPEEYKAEMEARRQEELEAKKPPPKPVKEMTPKELSSYTFNRVRGMSLNGKGAKNGCRH